MIIDYLARHDELIGNATLLIVLLWVTRHVDTSLSPSSSKKHVYIKIEHELYGDDDDDAPSSDS